MISKKIGIIGLGNVGAAVLESFKKYSPLISQKVPLKLEIVKVCDTNKARVKLARKFSLPFTSNVNDLINDSEIDIIVELIGGIEPARTIIVKSLKQGKSIVTANKALLATKGKEIFSLAEEKNKRIGFEASVCGAIPLIKSISEGLIGCEIRKMHGILNGTTNYILCKMEEENLDFNLALRQAQEKGLAEARPVLDVEGIDTLHKLCILSYLCYGTWPAFNKVYVEGISKISLLDVTYARQLNYRIKLLAIAKKEKSSLQLRVHPTLVPLSHPLAQVSAAYNAAYLDTQPAGELFFYGKGAGGVATSSSIIADIANIAFLNTAFIRKNTNIPIQNIRDIETRYYIRFIAADFPGVLAKISRILASLNISIASVNQKERKEKGVVPVVMLTHQAKEDNIKKAIASIDRLKVVKSPTQIIRIEDL